MILTPSLVTSVVTNSKILADLQGWLQSVGIKGSFVLILAQIIIILAIVIISFLINAISKKLVIFRIEKLFLKTKVTWDDVFVKNKVLYKFSHLFPALFIYFAATLLTPNLTIIIQKMSLLYLILAGMRLFDVTLNSFHEIYNSLEMAEGRPIKGYVQIVKLLFYLLGGVFLVSIIINQSPWGIITGIGAMTAIILLVFKDTIMGLVAGIKLTSHKMLNVGDWIEMPKYGADGSVIDITLNTVKVQNWDKTISTIPTHALISDSFKNWRGMEESEGRRIKRSFFVDMRSIKFLDQDLLKKMSQIHLLHDYLKDKNSEINTDNAEKKIDTKIGVNGRRLTNIGSFRQYVVNYLKQHPEIHKDMTFIVRQLAPTSKGLPIEIYVFSTNQAWAEYERIQSDIFDHILASIQYFDLRVFQEPSGHDFAKLT